MSRRAWLAVWIALGTGMAWSRAHARQVKGEVQVRGQPVAEAVVYLERLGDSVPPAPGRGRLDQRGLAFVPRVLVVSPGSTVEFPNSDPVMHNVFHPGEGAEAFDLGTYSSAEAKEVVFGRAGLYVVLCHVHPEMVGYVAVVPSILHAVTTEAGAFEIANVPSGQYLLHVWHRRLDDPLMAISVQSDEATVPIIVSATRRGRRGAER